MSEFDEKYNKIIEDISKNIKDEKELQFVKEKMNELSAIFINMFNQVNNSSEKRITDLEKNQKGLEEKINKVRQLNDLAKQRGQTLAEMAIAWLLKDDRVTSVLVGASSVAQLIDNLKALQNTAFSAEEIQMIENILQ